MNRAYERFSSQERERGLKWDRGNEGGLARNICIVGDLVPPALIAKSTVKLLVGGEPWNPDAFKDPWDPAKGNITENP